MSAFSNWAYEITHSLSDVALFFTNLVGIFPRDLVQLLWLFPALAVVMWMVRAFGHLASGGGE